MSEDFPGGPGVQTPHFTAEGTSLVGQLRSCMPHSAAIKKKKKKGRVVKIHIWIVILGWPKSSFKFFLKMLQKKDELHGQFKILAIFKHQIQQY